jgi:hypothetical protein
LSGGNNPPLVPAAQAKAAAADPAAPRVSFNRLLLRFGTLHVGFAACRAVFAGLVGPGEEGEGELSLEQLRGACTQLGYHLDDDSLARIFDGTDLDGTRSLNPHEFLATMAILHCLKARGAAGAAAVAAASSPWPGTAARLAPRCPLPIVCEVCLTCFNRWPPSCAGPRGRGAGGPRDPGHLAHR